MCALLSTLIRHAKLRASQAQTAAAQRAAGNKSRHFSFPAAESDPGSGTSGPKRTHIHTQSVLHLPNTAL